MEKGTYPTCFDSILKILEKAFVPSWMDPNWKSNVQTTILDLKFFKMFFWMLFSCEYLEYDWHFLYAINTMLPKLSRAIKEFIEDYECARHRHQSIIWYHRIQDIEKRIEQFKPQAKELCVLILSGSSSRCNQPRQHKLKLCLEQGREITSFIDFILQSLSDLLNSNLNLTEPLKQQIVFIQQKLQEFPRFINCANPSITRVKILSELLSRTQTWLKRISSLVCLYWINTPASTTETVMADLIKLMPYTPGVIASYVEGTMISQLLASYFDFLLKDLVMPMKGDIEVLCEGLIFLLSFVTNPPIKDSEDVELILPQMYAIINDLPSLICSLRNPEMREGISITSFSALLAKINGGKAKIGMLYATTPHSAESDVPRTNPIGFLDSLLRTVNKMLEADLNFIPSMKQQIEVLSEELMFLRTVLQDYIGLQVEKGKLKDLLSQAIVLLYHAAYVTHFSTGKNFPVWYSVAGLPNVIVDIKLINAEFQRIEYHEKYSDKELSNAMESSIVSPPEAITPKIEGTFIGFQEETKSIIDYLVWGNKDLTIISISGMPGQGKTTLAKKIYNEPQVQYHFHKFVWCYVSQKCTAAQILIKIGCVLIGAKAAKLELQDLVEWIRKSLKKVRYFIVMDDIWDVEIWRKVQGSFPNDSNGSRILFTSRNHNLASCVELPCISRRLRLFSKEESEELMIENLFSGDSEAQLELLDISRQIASYCKGLPLAVALTSSTLKRTEKKLDSWNKVAENLKSHLASEGCKNVIELSYKYLPDHLKSCFLFFGAFPRGRNIQASELKQLWMAEGFIRGDEMHCSEYLATEYLDTLVSQNLVVVVEKSSMGGVKICNVHDLLYDFCLEKANEENFLNWTEELPITDGCYISSKRYGDHRLCIRRADPFIRARSICTRGELPRSQIHSYFWFHHDCISNFWFPESCPVLKVLDLERVYLDCDSKFPRLILSNIHLKYLALNFGYVQIDCIPSSIANLWNLETLIVVAKELDDLLPDCMWQMKSLKHVKLCRARLCLKELEESNVLMGNNIETLGELELGSCPIKTAEFLKKLPSLGKLHCHIRDKGCYPLWFSMFGSIAQLQSLFIDGDFYKPALYVASSPINFPVNLKKLSLWGVYLPWSKISMIAEELPDLQVLKLVYGACKGSRWNLIDGDFPSLIYLKLENLDIEEIDVSVCEDNPFPCLEHLVVKNCYHLKEIPPIFEDMYTLKTIQMTGCPSEANNSLRRILKNQQDMGNDDLQVFVRGNSTFDAYIRLFPVDEQKKESSDWRTELEEKNRKMITNKITDTLCRHLPFLRLGDLKKIKKMAMTFEHRMFAKATSVRDYLRNISLKMLTVETKQSNTIESFIG